MVREKRSWTFAVGLAAVLIITGCGFQNGDDHHHPNTETNVQLSIALPGTTKNSLKLASAMGTVDDVVAVTVEVVETAVSSNIIVEETPLIETPEGSGNWELTLAGLPVGMELDFTGKAKNDASADIFTGVTRQTLTGGERVLLHLISVDDEVTDPNRPKILSATIAEKIEVNSTGNPITFLIEHNQAVEYSVSVIHGTITAPVEGEHDPANGPLTVNYDAPSTAIEDTITLTVNDPDNQHRVATAFTIGVVESGDTSLNVDASGYQSTALTYPSDADITWSHGTQETVTWDKYPDRRHDQPLHPAWRPDLPFRDRPGAIGDQRQWAELEAAGDRSDEYRITHPIGTDRCQRQRLPDSDPRRHRKMGFQ
jgi:hypothetical protein